MFYCLDRKIIQNYSNADILLSRFQPCLIFRLSVSVTAPLGSFTDETLPLGLTGAHTDVSSYGTAGDRDPDPESANPGVPAGTAVACREPSPPAWSDPAHPTGDRVVTRPFRDGTGLYR